MGRAAILHGNCRGEGRQKATAEVDISGVMRYNGKMIIWESGKDYVSKD